MAYIEPQGKDEAIDDYYRRVGKKVNEVIKKAILTELSQAKRSRMDSEKLEAAVTRWLAEAGPGAERFAPWIGGVIGSFFGDEIRLEKTGIEDYGITPKGRALLEEMNNPKKQEPAQRGTLMAREPEHGMAK